MSQEQRDRIAARLRELKGGDNPAQTEPAKNTAGQALADKLRVLKAAATPTASKESTAPEPIAIVGLAGMLPSCDSVQAFWQALDAGHALIREIPDDRFDWRAVYDPSGKRPNSMITRWGGFLPDPRGYDPAFFGTLPRHADYMDPRTRLLLMSIYHTLEDAGYAPSSLKGRKIALFLGLETDEYELCLREHGLLDDVSYLPAEFTANTLSHHFDFQGPSEWVNTLCSSGAVALHRAVQALRNGEAEQAVVGAANLILRPDPFIALSRSGQMSPEPTVRSFGANARGFLRAEGVGSVLLKPLSHAERDGDAVYGLIRASAVNYNGRGGVSIASPNIATHTALIADCYRRAGVDPRDVTYIETQGMGNPVADIAEWEACNQALRVLAAEQHVTLPPGFCRISTLKPFCGHMHAASALGALFKIVHALRGETIPAILGFDGLSRDLADPDQPCRVAQAGEPWRAGSRPRLAGLHSYGAGGSNAHLLIEEYRAEPLSHTKEHIQVLPISADTEAGCRAKVARILAASEGQPITSVARTLQSGRDAMAHRVAFAARTFDDWRTQVEAWLNDRPGSSVILPQENPSSQPTQQDPADLAQAWVNGTAINWPQSQARRLHLPGHSFQRINCWYDGDSQENPPSQPSTDSTAERATGIVRDLLAAQHKTAANDLNLDTPFRELGFDSLLVVQLADTLNNRHGVRIEPSQFFEFTTPRQLVAHLTHALEGNNSDAGQKPATNTHGHSDEPIAIIGVAGCYPQAPDLDTFWQNLRAGRDCIDEVPAERWSADFYDPDPNSAVAAGRSYGRWGGFLKDLYHFDARFFGIAPREALLMNPKERILLQNAWHALEDAGYTPASLSEETVGVFVGVTKAGTDPYPGTFASTANRISYSFDFNGPSFPIDTMCSSSLVAVHEACRHLRDGECSVALAGGVNAYVDPSHFAVLAAGRFLSPDGRCRSFGEGANGMVPGEGVGTLLLKKLSQAEQDGDQIYAVIRGSALNHGGRTNGFTVPNPEAHRALIRTALDRAGVSARSVSYVEAHGTGTALGDPIEVRGLTRAFAADTDDTGFCSLGSVKSNIGHLEAAAGISGITKILLQMKHQTLVPSLHAATNNRQIDFPSTPFQVQQDCTAWQPTDGKGRAINRIACISSFGAGGGNAHVVLEAYNPPARASLPQTEPVAVILSGADQAALGRQAKQLLAYVEGRTAVAAPAPCEQRQTHLTQLRHMTAAIIDVTADELDIQEPFADYGLEPIHLEHLRHQTNEAFPDLSWSEVSQFTNLADLADAIGRTTATHEACPCRVEEGLADLAFTLQVGRQAMKHRFACFTDSYANLAQHLRTLIDNPEGPFEPPCFRGVATEAAEGRGAEYDTPDARLAAWVAGGAVAWQKQHEGHGRRRISLPGYPFAGKTYRLGSEQANETVAGPATTTPADTKPAEVVRDTEMLAWSPAWEAVPDGAAEAGEGKHLRFLCGFPDLETTPSNTVLVLNSEAATPAQRFTDIAVALFEQLRDVFRARQGKTRVQVVVPSNSDAGYAGLTGLLQTARQENPDIQCQLIEVDTPAATHHLPSTLPAHEPHLRLRDGRAERRVWREQPDFAANARQASGPWRDGAGYLITGGLGALGLMVAREIANHAENPTLILTGRSPLTDARRAQIGALEALGAQVRYERVDVACWEQVSALLGPYKETCRGIVHCAGVLRDGFLLHKTVDDFRAVLAPKVTGTANLQRATRDWDLDFTLLFSSGAGAFGNVGQADYAAANGWMDAQAALPEQRLTAVNWPLWREGGMTMNVAGERLMRRRTGATSLQTEHGMQALRQLLDQDVHRLMIVEGDADVIRENLNRPKERVSSGDTPVNTDGLREPLLDRLCALLGETIGLPANEIDPEEALDGYGIDSVLTMELTDALERVFGALSKTLFYQYLNLADLGEFLLENHASGCRQWVEPDEAVRSQPTPPPQPVATAPAAAKPGNDTNDPYRDAVAVIGLSARHPQAEDLETFWDNLTAGREAVREVPADRWNTDRLEQAGAHYGAFLDDAYAFDPLFFKMTPREAANIDPQERLFLQTAWHALEDAGYAPAHLPPELRRRFGVFAGITKQGFNLTGLDVAGAFPTTSFAAVANRVSYQLNLQGPSFPVDTMCASSLTALHEACAYLRRGDGDMALAGGVNLYLHPATYQALSLGQILASGPHCAAFCHEGDGFVPGEAVGAVVLKRYHQAMADRDSIYGVIRGSAVNHGGRTNGFTIPNPNQQATVIREALDQAGIEPDSVGYIEAAANGSPMGDTLEMTALTDVFGQGPRVGYHLGSIKPSIGHGESASGISQLTRVLMALQRKTLPATLIHGSLNDDIPFDRLPFNLVRETTAWTPLEQNGRTLPRRAGISNTSAGGVNAHLIVEAHPATTPTARKGPFLFVLSALTRERLTAYAADWRTWLANHGDRDPAALAYTLQVGRQPLPFRLAVIADDLAGFAAGLTQPAYEGRVEKGRRSDRAAVQRALDSTDLEQLATLWVAGHTVPWPQFQTGLPRLNGLPTYPFTRKICRIDEPAEATVPSSLSGTMLVAEKEPPIQEEFENAAAEFYAHATQGADENFQEEYLTFAPFEEKIPGFSSSRIWLDPLGNPDDYALMKAKQREMRQVLFCGEDFQRIDSMLDFGCGRGTDVIQVAEHFPHMTTHGFTITKVQAELGNRRIASRNLAPRAQIFHKDSAVDPFPGRYDLVIGIEVSFHIRDKDALFGKIAKALKSGGRVLLMDYIANLRGPIVDHDVEVTILTRQNWLDLLARHGLRISEIIDVSPQVANFLYDPECRENIKGQPQVTQNLWLNHANQATALERGWITYGLMKFEKEAHLDEAALYRHNEHQIDHQTPYPEAVRAMFRSEHIPYPVTPPDEMIPAAPAATTQPAPRPTTARPDLSTVRTRLVAIFAKVLGFEKREILENDSFEALGISSINAVELLEAVNTAFDLYLPTSIVFECNDLDSFSRYVCDQMPDQAVTPSTPEPEPVPVAVPVSPPTRVAETPAPAATPASPFRKPRMQEIDDIAVIGLACRCAGADDQRAFWQRISEGADCLERVVDASTVNDFEAGSAEHALLRYGIMRDPDCFDPLFFHISPKEAEMMDYAQRILLEECYKALEDAGIAPGSLKKKRVGTYIGVTGEQRAVSQNSHLAILGADASILAARIAFYLDLKGPALAVNTACSSSLVAMDLAYRALQQGEIDLAIAGGITISGQVGTYASMNNAGMISPTGTCRPFDNKADGIVVGDGVGIVIMQRQSDAYNQRNHAYGVIRGSGTNQDGRTSGITVPGFLAQSDLEASVYRRAGISAADIQYVEAHGTATKLGDPIEIHGLTHSFAQFTDKKQFCAIGSLKGNIGHTAAAAGVLSAIKLLLSLKHQTMPPSIHFNRENEHIDFKNSPVFVNTARKPWRAGPNGVRLGVVSSFGYSGTNAHMLFSDPDPVSPTPANQDTPRLWVLSARSKDCLRRQARNLATWLQNHPEANVADAAYTLQVGRDAMNERLAFVAASHPKAVSLLNAWLAGEETDAGLSHGQVQRGDRLGLFDTDEELQEAVTRWVQRGKLERLSALWTQGLAVDWDLLYDTKPRRISMPGYAFKRERIPLGGHSSKAGSKPEATEQTQAEAPAEPPAPQTTPDWDGFSFLPEWFNQTAPTATTPHQGRSILIVSAGKPSDLIGALSRESRQSQASTVLRLRLNPDTRRLAEREWLCAPEADAFATCLGNTHFDTVFFAISPGDKHPLGRDERALLHLIQHLRRGDDDFDLFVIETEGETAGRHGSGLTGLACAIAQGSRIRVRNLKVSGTADSNLVTHILCEPASERGAQIRIQAGRRQGRRFLKLSLKDMPDSGLRRNGTYLLVGGSGAVGRVITEHLQRDFSATVIWIGRRDAETVAATGGVQPAHYFQADITDAGAVIRAVQTMKQRVPTLHGAVFAGLVYHAENGITMDHDRFAEMIDVKIKGSLNLYQALADEPLDFMCWFSSVQAFAFLSASESAGYATGITAADSLVAALREKARFPLGTVNWGYWRTSVEGTPLAARIQNHFETIADAEGFRFFSRFTGALRAGRLHQALYVGTSVPVRRLMACPEATLVEPAPGNGPALIDDLRHYQNERSFAAFLKNDPWPELNAWMARLLFVQLRRLGLFTDNTPHHPTTLRRQAQVMETYARWWDECCLGILEGAGLLHRHGDEITTTATGLNQTEAVWDEWGLYRERYRDNPDLKTAVALVESCLQALPEILRGERQATEVMFPRSSMEKVENMYQRNVLSDFFNSMVADLVVRAVQARIAADPGVRVRVIEIGAGTGGTTALVLPALKPFAANIEEYCYTDVSRAFLMHAAKKYGPETPFLSQDLWNVEQPAADQGLDRVFDIAVATNVLHATRDIRTTLRNVAGALNHNGLLILNENITKTTLGTLTFGLLDGWWRYEDADLRMPGCPLLNPEGWQQVLAETGWTSILPARDAARALGQQIIVAQSNGWVQRTTAEPPHPTTPVKAKRTRKLVKTIPAAPLDHHQRVTAVVRQALSHTLNLAPADIEGRVPFSDYGIDSILGVTFMDQINQDLGITMNTTILFDQTTVDALSAHILKHHAGHLQATATSETQTIEVIEMDDEPLADNLSEKPPAPTQQPIAAVATQERDLAVAVIGIAGRFPGANDPDTFWQNMVAGRSGIIELPEEYCRDGSYRWGGILNDRHCFDPLFFHIAPKEAEVMNVHQRLVLEESWKALEDAGYNPRDLADSRTGIYIGAEPSGQINASLTGSSDAVIASRLSYHLNLKGPAMVVNTGCSSSGVALHLACESLRSGESELALAGGVFATMVADGLGTLAEIEMLSPTGCCHTFDSSANGTVLSEGVGMVVLKRLRDALADGDPIHGVIAASGVNQDGASNGITAPNGAAQERLMREVYQRFGINPAEIGYFEAHGTGTRLGDPVEANAIVRALSQGSEPHPGCVLGSAKSFIGHTSAAAGVIGLIKILLSLKHRQLPPMLNFQTLNPLIEMADSPFTIPTQSAAWPARHGRPRTAALNSFGHSGTNAHLVVREYPTATATANPTGPYLVVLSARDEQRLREAAERLATFVTDKDPNLADVAYTLQVGRDAMEERLAFLVHTNRELTEQIRSFLADACGANKPWFRGQVRPNREMIHLLNGDGDMLPTLDAWIANRRHTRLLELWVRGLPLDWERLYKQGARPRRIHLPPYPFARNRYTPQAAAASVMTEATPQAVPTTAVKPAPKEEIPDSHFGYLPRWEEVAAQAPDPAAANHRLVVFVFNGESFRFEEDLAYFYRNHHPDTCIIRIRLADQTRRRDENAWLCNVDDPQGPAACLAETPLPDALFFIAPFQERDAVLENTALTQSIQSNEIQVLRFVKTLQQRMQANDILDCYLLTVDNHADLEQPNPYGAGLSGLACAVAQGDHRIRVRNLDLTREEMADDGERRLLPTQILAEPSSDRGDVVRLQYGLRRRRHFVRLDGASLKGSALRQGGVYVILGGSGVVGRIITRYLIQEYAAKVVWLGRRSVSDPTLRERLAAFGMATPHYVQADVTDADAVQAAVNSVHAQFGAIHGAIFSGLVFDPENSVAHTDEAAFRAVLDVKTKGSLNFYNAFRTHRLDFMFWFSSIQAFSFLAARDSAAYATGITFADTFARALGDAPFPVGIINWGYWAASVRGTPLEAQLAAHFAFIEDENGFRYFEKATALLNHGVTQMLCHGPRRAVRQLMHCNDDDIISIYESSTSIGI